LSTYSTGAGAVARKQKAVGQRNPYRHGANSPSLRENDLRNEHLFTIMGRACTSRASGLLRELDLFLRAWGARRGCTSLGPLPRRSKIFHFRFLPQFSQNLILNSCFGNRASCAEGGRLSHRLFDDVRGHILVLVADGLRDVAGICSHLQSTGTRRSLANMKCGGRKRESLYAVPRQSLACWRSVHTASAGPELGMCSRRWGPSASPRSETRSRPRGQKVRSGAPVNGAPCWSPELYTQAPLNSESGAGQVSGVGENSRRQWQRSPGTRALSRRRHPHSLCQWHKAGR
jgi:hypothetical protein